MTELAKVLVNSACAAVIAWALWIALDIIQKGGKR